jgi:hypothetical protein
MSRRAHATSRALHPSRFILIFDLSAYALRTQHGSDSLSRTREPYGFLTCTFSRYCAWGTVNPVSLPPSLPGQGKRLLGSLIVILGGGLVLETSYQWGGIGVILLGGALVTIGWKEFWQGQKREARSNE